MIRESIKGAKCLMGDRNASTEPSLQGTVLTSSSPEASIYSFRIKIFAVLMHSHFSMKHLDLLKRGGGEECNRQPFFQTSNIFSKHFLFVDFHCQLQSMLLVS